MKITSVQIEEAIKKLQGLNKRDIDVISFENGYNWAFHDIQPYYENIVDENQKLKEILLEFEKTLDKYIHASSISTSSVARELSQKLRYLKFMKLNNINIKEKEYVINE